MSVYTDNGYADRKEYLHGLADEFGCPYETVVMLASMLGPNEDFDGLVSMLEEYETYETLHEDEAEGEWW